MQLPINWMNLLSSRGGDPYGSNILTNSGAANTTDFVDTNEDGTPDHFNKNGACDGEITAGVWKLTRTTFSWYGVSASIFPNLITVGEDYKFIIKYRGTVAGLRFSNTSHYVLSVPTTEWQIVEVEFTAQAIAWLVTAINAPSGYFDVDYMEMQLKS